MNQLDEMIHDWGWWNRAYTRFLISSRGYHLVSMPKVLPAVQSLEELVAHKNGALLWLEPRLSLHDLRLPRIALGENADYVVDYYKREFAPREDRPWIAYFDKPILYGRQFSILDSQRHAFEQCFTRDRRWREGVPKRHPRVTAKKVPGIFLLAGSEFHNHYAHLFCDVLPRLMLFEEAGLKTLAPALLPPPSHAFAEEAWRKMGLAGKGSVRWDDTAWELDGLYFASPFKKFCSWTPEAAAWIRTKLCPGNDFKTTGKKMFYVSRGKSTRSILNQEEILAQLASYDITVVEPEKLSLDQQINLFSEAGLIMGPHGAGIQNALWAPHGCRVLELVNVDYFSGVYWTLAKSLAQPYGLVTGKSAPGMNPLQDGYLCDPKLVKQAVDQLIQVEDL